MNRWRKLLVRLRVILWHIIGPLRDTWTVNTKIGKMKLRYGRQDTIASNLFATGEYEADTLRWVFGLIGRRQTLLDVGANVGVTSISALRSGYATSAVAIEPDAHTFALLNENCQLNQDAGNVVTICAAAGSGRRLLSGVHLSVTNSGDSHMVSGYQAPIIKLDELPVELLPDVVWIDAQGSEYDILGGAPITAMRGAVPFVMELWPAGLQRCGVELWKMARRISQMFYWMAVVEDAQLRIYRTEKYMLEYLHALNRGNTFATVVLFNERWTVNNIPPSGFTERAE